MMLGADDVRFYLLFVSLLVIVPSISAQNKNAEWFESDEVSTSTSTTSRGTRRTTWQFVPRVTKYGPHPVADVSTKSSSSVPPPPLFTTTSNLTNTITTLLKNFAKFATSNRLPSEDDGNEYFAQVLTLEIFTVANGNHFMVPPTEDKELAKKERKRAAGTVALWLDLFCTEDVDAILNEVVRETVIQYRSTRDLLAVDTMHEILQTLFKKLNDTIEEDSFLASMYKAEQIRYLIRFFHAEAEPKVYVPLGRVTQGTVDGGMLDAWLNDVDVRKFFIHRQFLDMRKESGGEGEREDINHQNRADAVWARTVLRVARETCCIAKMQKVYDAALNDTARNFDISQFPHHTIRLFADKLNESVEADETLKSEWTKQMNNRGRQKLRITKSKH